MFSLLRPADNDENVAKNTDKGELLLQYMNRVCVFCSPNTLRLTEPSFCTFLDNVASILVRSSMNGH